MDLIDEKQWSSLSADVKGDAYEGLLQKNAEDAKGGAVVSQCLILLAICLASKSR